MGTITKARSRLFYAGRSTFRLITPDRGWGGPYGQERRYASWQCIECGVKVSGTNQQPEALWRAKCITNGHAPCRSCGKPLPRLDDGCPREHNWRNCPGKTEADRVQPQHPHREHLARTLTEKEN